MIRVQGTTPLLALVASAVLLAAAAPVCAGMININVTGFRVDYSTDDNQLHDRQTDAGGNLNPAEAVKLTGTEFQFDDTLITQYSTSMGEQTYADTLIKDISPALSLPSLGTPFVLSTGDNQGTFGFDWFYDDGGTMRNLRLKFGEVNVALIYNGNATKPTLLITGSTANWTQQNLPGSLKFADNSDISFSYTTSNTMAMTGQEFDLLAMGGVMQISGEGEIVIPEPSTGVLTLSVLCTLVLVTHLRQAGRKPVPVSC